MTNDKIISYVNTLCDKLHINDYIGVIVYGSYVGKRNNSLSDLDVMIIRSNYSTQDCGSLMIDGVRVEYFIQDLERLYKLIKEEVKNNDPSHLTKFVTCEILYDTDNKVVEFINYAEKLYNTKITPEFGDDEKFSIFSINNRIEDLESLIDDDSFYAVYYIILERIRTLFATINGIIDLPLTKIKNIYEDVSLADKYISSPIHNLPDEKFIDLYLECQKLCDRKLMLNNIKNLYYYSFNNLEFDPNNFCLRYTKKPPFKV